MIKLLKQLTVNAYIINIIYSCYWNYKFNFQLMLELLIYFTVVIKLLIQFT